MSKCNNCQQEIAWPKPYVKGNLPNNPDGSPHRCKTEKTESKGIDFAKLSAEVKTQVLSTQKTNPVNLANIQLEHDIKVKICNTCKEANKVLQVIEWQAWENLGLDASPARVGMYVNNIASKLLYVPMTVLKTQEDEDEKS